MCRRCFSRPSTRVSGTAGKLLSDFFFFFSRFLNCAVSRCVEGGRRQYKAPPLTGKATAPRQWLSGLYGDGPIESGWKCRQKGKGGISTRCFAVSLPATSHRGACGIERRIAAWCRFSCLLFHLATRCVCIRCTASVTPCRASVLAANNTLFSVFILLYCIVFHVVISHLCASRSHQSATI